MPRRLKIRKDDAAIARSSGVLRYALAWLVGGAAAATLLVVLIGGDDEVTLPPVKQTQLEDAARVARCEFRRPRPGEALDPPVEGPRSAAALGPGVYDEPERPESVVAALREGAIVVQYRSGLDESRVEQLKDLQLAVPDGTIVLPAEATTSYEVTVTAWRRLLGCPRFTDAAIDAVRLFRGRFIGRGPDRRP